MATAAPAAAGGAGNAAVAPPAGGAPPAAPAAPAAPAPGGQTRNADGTFAPGTAKPITGRRPLPGTIEPPAKGSKLDGPAISRKLGPLVLPPADGAAPDAAADPAAVDPNAPPKTDEAKPGKLKVLGKEFESVEQLEQNLKSLQGQFKAFKTQTAQAKDFALRANDSAGKWKAAHDRVKAQLAEVSRKAGLPIDSSVQPQPGERPTDGGAADSLADVLNGAGVNEAAISRYRALSQEQGPELATLWLLGQVLRAQNKAVDTKVKSAVDPFRNEHAARGLQQQAQEIVVGLAEITTGKDAAGQPVYAYPELSDPEAVAAIGEFWKRLPFAPEKILSNLGLHTAILNYRDWIGRQGGGRRAAAPTPPNAAAAAAAAAVTAGADSGGGDALGGPQPTPLRVPANSAELRVAAVKQSMREAEAPDPVLGFVRRKRTA